MMEQRLNQLRGVGWRADNLLQLNDVLEYRFTEVCCRHPPERFKKTTDYRKLPHLRSLDSAAGCLNARGVVRVRDQDKAKVLEDCSVQVSAGRGIFKLAQMRNN
jgi:hypothetical protein